MPKLVHLFLWGTVGSCLLFFVNDPRCKRIITRNWKHICLLLLLAFLWRLPFDGHFFYGLEYEDSYVYAVAGRYFSAGKTFCEPNTSCYLITVCVVGNWNSCKATETFSGHFIGYPAMIAAASRVFGYSPAIASDISLFASLLAVVLIFIVCELIELGQVTGLAGSFVFSLTPAFAVYGVGTYAEPVSNALVLVCLLLCVCLLNPIEEESSFVLSMNWLALTLSALLASLVKRENLLLIPVLLLAGLVIQASNETQIQSSQWQRYSMTVITTFSCIGFGLYQLQVMTTIRSETAEYTLFPFNLSALHTMFPQFMKSYASFSWYFGSGIFVALGLYASIKSHRRGLYPICLFLAYLGVYASHVRSYYELHGGGATEFDTLRYSMNMAGLWAIVAGMGVSYVADVLTRSQISRQLGKFSPVLVWFLIATYVLCSWVVTSRLKEDMVNNEFLARLRPAESAIRLASSSGIPNTVVITAEPLVIQMTARDALNVIGLAHLNSEVVQNLLKENPSVVFLYLEESSYVSRANTQRYGQGLALLARAHGNQLDRDSHYAIYRLEFPASALAP